MHSTKGRMPLKKVCCLVAAAGIGLLHFLGCGAPPSDAPEHAAPVELSGSRGRADEDAPLLRALEAQNQTLERMEAELKAIHGELEAIRNLQSERSSGQNADDSSALATAGQGAAETDLLSYQLQFRRRDLERGLLEAEANAISPPPIRTSSQEGNVVRVEESPGDPAQYRAKADLLRQMRADLEEVASLEDLARWMAQYNQR
jgi:TolA-binding protein